MNKNLTEIAYILDRSGSMDSMVEPAIAGFNQFLKEQREAPGQARLTLVLSRKMHAFRHHAATGEELPDLAPPMQDIVAEEQDKDDESK